jgi:hypothetical protein
MFTHPRRSRLAVAGIISGTLACGALAGPAMAASDPGSDTASGRKAGGCPTCTGTPFLRKKGGDVPEYLMTPRKAGGLKPFQPSWAQPNHTKTRLIIAI